MACYSKLSALPAHQVLVAPSAIIPPHIPRPYFSSPGHSPATGTTTCPSSCPTLSESELKRQEVASHTSPSASSSTMLPTGSVPGTPSNSQASEESEVAHWLASCSAASSPVTSSLNIAEPLTIVGCLFTPALLPSSEPRHIFVSPTTLHGMAARQPFIPSVYRSLFSGCNDSDDAIQSQWTSTSSTSTILMGYPAPGAILPHWFYTPCTSTPLMGSPTPGAFPPHWFSKACTKTPLMGSPTPGAILPSFPSIESQGLDTPTRDSLTFTLAAAGAAAEAATAWFSGPVTQHSPSCIGPRHCSPSRTPAMHVTCVEWSVTNGCTPLLDSPTPEALGLPRRSSPRSEHHRQACSSLNSFASPTVYRARDHSAFSDSTCSPMLISTTQEVVGFCSMQEADGSPLRPRLQAGTTQAAVHTSVDTLTPSLTAGMGAPGTAGAVRSVHSSGQRSRAATLLTGAAKLAMGVGFFALGHRWGNRLH